MNSVERVFVEFATKDDPKAQIVAAFVGGNLVTVGRAQEFFAVIKTSGTTGYSVFVRGSKLIRAPLPDVPAEVADPEFIGRKTGNRRGLMIFVHFQDRAVVANAHGRWKGDTPRITGRFSAAALGGALRLLRKAHGGAPLCIGWQSIYQVRGKDFFVMFLFGEPIAEFGGVMPCDFHHGMIGALWEVAVGNRDFFGLAIKGVIVEPHEADAEQGFVARHRNKKHSRTV